MIYRFEDHVLDTERRELHRGSALQSVEPQVFDLLEYLIRNRERVVSRDEILCAVWQGRIISDATLFTRVNAVRRVIGDSGIEQRLICTKRNKGFRFVGKIREDQEINAPPPSNDLSAHNFHAIAGDRPTIAILPFLSIGGDTELEYMADSLTEDLITSVAKLAWCRVLSRNCAFSYRGKAIDAKEVAQKHSVRYILEGSVRPIAGNVRITIGLIDGITNYHIWTDKIDTKWSYRSNSHEDVVARLLRGINLSLVHAEAKLPHGDCAFINGATHGWALLYKPVNRTNTGAAIKLFEQVVDDQTISSRALTGLALGHIRNIINVWSNARGEHLRLAESLAIRALAIEPDSAKAHYVRGLIFRQQGQLEESIREYEAAVSLDPSLAPAYAQTGQSWVRLGHAKKAFALTDKALRLSPRDPNRAIWWFSMGSAHLYLAQYDAALKTLTRAIQADPDYDISYALLASAYALIGNRTAAQRAVVELQRLAPKYSVGTFKVFAHGQGPVFGGQVQRVCDGLRKAGLSES